MATVDEQTAKLGYQASSAKPKRSHRKPGDESPDAGAKQAAKPKP
jgi:hypothetical protein